MKSKNFISLLTGMALLITCCLGVNVIQTAAAKTEKKQTIRVGIPSSDLLAFFETDKNGNLSGSDIELAQNIGAALGREVVFDRTAANNDELTKKLENGEIDMVVATYSRSLERAQRVGLSNPYLSIGMGIMVNKQSMIERGINKNPVSYMKNHDEKIAVVKGTSHVELCRKLFPECEVVEAKSYEEASELVYQKKAFAFFCGELEFYSQFLKQPQLQLYTSIYIFSDIKDEFCVAVPKKDREFLELVNLYLETSRPVKIEDILKRYQGYYSALEDKHD